MKLLSITLRGWFIAIFSWSVCHRHHNFLSLPFIFKILCHISSINITSASIVLRHAMAAWQALCNSWMQEFCLKFIVKESTYNQIVMSKEFETIAQPLMVEIIRRRQMPAVRSLLEPMFDYAGEQLGPLCFLGLLSSLWLNYSLITSCCQCLV